MNVFTQKLRGKIDITVNVTASGWRSATEDVAEARQPTRQRFPRPHLQKVFLFPFPRDLPIAFQNLENFFTSLFGWDYNNFHFLTFWYGSLKEFKIRSLRIKRNRERGPRLPRNGSRQITRRREPFLSWYAGTTDWHENYLESHQDARSGLSSSIELHQQRYWNQSPFPLSFYFFYFYLDQLVNPVSTWNAHRTQERWVNQMECGFQSQVVANGISLAIASAIGTASIWLIAAQIEKQKSKKSWKKKL